MKAINRPCTKEVGQVDLGAATPWIRLSIVLQGRAAWPQGCSGRPQMIYLGIFLYLSSYQFSVCMGVFMCKYIHTHTDT